MLFFRSLMKSFSQCVILFGGSSEERMVSVASAQNLGQHIPEALLWYWSKTGEIFEISSDELKAHQNAFTSEFSPSGNAKYRSLESAIPQMVDKKIIIGLHGTEGEDGTLQKILEENNISYTGSNSQASQLAFNKRLTKKLASNHGLPVVSDLEMTSFDEKEIWELTNFFDKHRKVVLKPLANGSSVGLFIISNQEELKLAISRIKSKPVIPYMAEPFIEGRELTVGVWQRSSTETISLPCSEVRVNQGGKFDYQGKYLGQGVEEITPAILSAEETSICQNLSLRLHQLIGCKGYSRTDMILTDQGPILLEINTLPGLTKASFIPQQLAAISVDLRTFFSSQIDL